MTNKSIILVATLLAGLTLGSFALISSLVSKPAYHSNSANPASAATSLTAKAGTALFTAPPPNAPARSAVTDKELYNDLSRAQALLNQIRTAVLTNDWAAGQSQFGEFDQRTQRWPAPQLNQPDFSPVMQDLFTLYRIELARALNEQNAINARFCLNQLYAIVGEQHARLSTHGLPLELIRLNYLVREVELWAHLENETLLTERRKALLVTWQEVRPIIAAQPSGRATASHFDTLLEQLGAAQELGTLVAQCNQDLEQMGALFQRNSTHSASTSRHPGKLVGDE